MKKILAIALLVLTTACAQTETSNMGSGMTCEKCPCCQKMMESGMKDGIKSGMQCPMMKGDKKDGMQCSCCKGMMKDGMMEKKSMPSTNKPADSVNHNAHHPAQ